MDQSDRAELAEVIAKAFCASIMGDRWHGGEWNEIRQDSRDACLAAGRAVLDEVAPLFAESESRIRRECDVLRNENLRRRERETWFQDRLGKEVAENIRLSVALIGRAVAPTGQEASNG